MTQRSFLIVFILATHVLQSMYGCMPHPTTQPINLPKLIVHENTILSEGQPYAELRFFRTTNLSENRGEAYLFARATQHRGIAVYYYGDGS